MQEKEETAHLANAILRYCKEKTQPISPMKLMKIIYFCVGYSLIEFNQPLTHETIFAGKNLPLFDSVLAATRKFSGSFDIQEYQFKTTTTKNFSKDQVSLIKEVVDQYAHLGAFDLSDVVTEKGSPYVMALMESKKDSNIVISHKSLKSWFANKINTPERRRSQFRLIQ